MVNDTETGDDQGLPDYVIVSAGERDAMHPFGDDAYRIANVATGETRIYPSREAALRWAIEVSS